MGKATAMLRQDHEAILRVLDATEVAVRRIHAGEVIYAETLNGLVEFFRLFADACHHGKEEELLFPMLERRGMQRVGGPTGVMMHEHEVGRALVRQMAESVDACNWGEDSQKGFSAAARQYIDLLRQHIFKEDNILFVMAENILSEEEQEKLAAEFEKVEKEKMGLGTCERLHGSMEQLLAELSPS